MIWHYLQSVRNFTSSNYLFGVMWLWTTEYKFMHENAKQYVQLQLSGP